MITLIFIIIIFTIIELPALLVLGLWFLLQLLPAFSDPVGGGGGGVAYFAHIGGFVFGLLADQAVRQPRPRGLRGGAPDAGVLMARTLVLVGSLAIICLLAFLTITVAIDEGIDVSGGPVADRARAARLRGAGRADLARRPMAERRSRRRRRPQLLATLVLLLAPARRGARPPIWPSWPRRTRAARRPSRWPPARRRREAAPEPPSPAADRRRAGAGHPPERRRRLPRAAAQAAARGARVRPGHRRGALAPAARCSVLPMASLTKIMTALRGGRADAAGRAGADHAGGARLQRHRRSGLLPKGRRVRLETLLNGLLLVSGNDAAIALAVHVAAHERRFAAMMNRRARRWGLELHPLRLVARARGRQPLLRARPRGADPAGDGRAAHPPHRPPAPGGASASRSRAASST